MNAHDFSPHARRRLEQRAISVAAVEAALRWGHRYRQRDGRVVHFLGRRQAERAVAREPSVSEFEGTAVVVARDGTVVTVVRTHDTRRFRRHVRGHRPRRRH